MASIISSPCAVPLQCILLQGSQSLICAVQAVCQIVQAGSRRQ